MHSAFQDLLLSFCSAVQPFFVAVDPVAVFIHHDVLHLSSFNILDHLSLLLLRTGTFTIRIRN